jgi:hypothetical protein
MVDESRPLARLSSERLLFSLLVAVSFLATCTSGRSVSQGDQSSVTSPSSSHGEGGYAAWCDSPNCPPGGVPDSLRRQLELPTLVPGESCPVTRAHKLDIPDWLGGYVLGDGPIYALLVSEHPAQSTEVLSIGGTAAPVKWLSSPDYRGPVLVRGHQLDGRARSSS